MKWNKLFLHRKLYILMGLSFFVFVHYLLKMRRFVITYDLSKLVTKFEFGKSIIPDLFTLLIYLLFDVLFQNLESLLHFY